MTIAVQGNVNQGEDDLTSSNFDRKFPERLSIRKSARGESLRLSSFGRRSRLRLLAVGARVQLADEVDLILGPRVESRLLAFA